MSYPDNCTIIKQTTVFETVDTNGRLPSKFGNVEAELIGNYLKSMELSEDTINLLRVGGLVAVLIAAILLTRGGFRTKPSDDREDTTTVVERYLGSRGHDSGD